MISMFDFASVYLHRETVDFRKSIDGLSAIVENEMGLSPLSKHLFVFTNRNRSRIKILYWDKTGFALWFKRLETERFPWPRKFEKDVIELKPRELAWLLEGYEFWKMKPHSIVNYACVS